MRRGMTPTSKGAARFVGRVGGLAVVFGVGTAVFTSATAWADRGDAGETATVAADSTVGTRIAPARAPRSTAATPPRSTAATPPRSTAAPDAQRQRAVRAPQPTAASTASQTSRGITVNPVVTFADGIFAGQLNATSSRGLDLKYSVVGGRTGGSNGGKLSLGTNINAPISAQGFTLLPYRTWDNAGVGKGSEDWQVRVSEVTKFDEIIAKIPLAGLVASQIIGLLQQTPLVGTLLAPLIGTSVLATVSADIARSAPGMTPMAFTYKVPSFDGTLISTNWFPAAGLAIGDTAPTVFNGPGLGEPGETDPYAECRHCGHNPAATAVGTLRRAGYNAVTWDPRGEFDSGGVMQLDNPFYEGRDVSALITWMTSDTPAMLNKPGDPRVGMIGGSYGGGIQLVSAGTDPRIDAIVPDISWNSLDQSLYPSEIFKTSFGSLLVLALVLTNARVNHQIYAGALTGDLFGRLSESSQAALGSSGSTALLAKLTVPTLLSSGTVDVLFPLAQSMANAQSIIGNGTIAKVIWFCGGHGYCADPVSPDQASTLRTGLLDWLNTYVAETGDSATAVPKFQWFDQVGGHYSAAKLPYEAGFNDLPPIEVTSPGGRLGIVPVIGGSGPGAGPVIIGLGGGSPARNAIDVPLTVAQGTQVVGAPTLSFTYRGVGNSRAVFAQIVDESTGLVLGQQVTPVPVTLDGKTHDVTIDLNNIVYTYAGTKAGSLTLQITSSATAYENSSIGLINISDVNVVLPNRWATSS